MGYSSWRTHGLIADPDNKVVVRLAAAQRDTLLGMIRTGTHPAAMIRRAQVLLKADANGPGAWSDTRIGEAFGCSFMTARRVRRQFVAEGLDATLYRKLDGKQEARLVAVACSPTPEGHARWTMVLLAGRLVDLKVVESIDPATVRRILKKRSQALAQAAVGHPAEGQRFVRSGQGRRAGGVRPSGPNAAAGRPA